MIPASPSLRMETVSVVLERNPLLRGCGARRRILLNVLPDPVERVAGDGGNSSLFKQTDQRCRVQFERSQS